MSDRLEKLEQRKAKISAEIAKVRAREIAQDRRADTRKKVLAGALLLGMVERGEWPHEKFDSALDRFLTRDQDRVLFNLPAQGSYTPETE